MFFFQKQKQLSSDCLYLTDINLWNPYEFFISRTYEIFAIKWIFLPEPVI